ncbi:zf-MIZ-domain-containing protein [Basidiobolus meristosporus CBS 931.73]|uniref:Zf-MIZ-domain-containing protein n=1 Tax=Basidiobolus meristosporus CBS 931.73 TaxID=1314790 RepID=A0A1Y1Y3K0_9FUNG|nr:zf-MIZ-domain-containing protein [Basidiobolus meristosporus CBS 931.73]|eukprot:ORX92573.1 zf-MIZ-domain-containing protein [Basidiobolus meristosporus CBS 931.73]
MAENQDPEFRAFIEKKVPTLPVATLKKMIRTLNRNGPSQFYFIKLSGNKAELVKRLQTYLLKAEQSPNSAARKTAKTIVLAECESPADKSKGSTYDWSPLTFKSSPFYTIIERISPYKLCEAQNSVARVTIGFRLRSQHIMQLKTPDLYRAMLFSTDVDLDHLDPGSLKEKLIEFPLIANLDVNQQQFTGNLQGSKRKPGTTNPADISDLCIHIIDRANSIQFVYPACPKAYIMALYLVKISTVEEIVEKIKTHKKMEKATVLEKINRSSNDADIEATSSLVSLKCPLGYQRIQFPCRSSYCNHIQCFDGVTFLKLNERTPSWTCPICNRVLNNWNELVLDGYFEDILDKVDADVDRVVVEVDGSWRIPDKEQDKEEPVVIKREDIIIHTTSDSESDLDSPHPTPEHGAKRSSQIIDLTLSSDEESWVQPKRSRPNSRPHKK